ncbi:MAG TPA: carboxypeptidase-like regulatory domain-containing protein, partial [Ignavibacteriaceae bacterium]
MQKLLLISAIILLSNSLFAQDLTGYIYGKVYDASTKQAIPFANVIVIGTNNGAATDENGYFKITDLPVNTYQVRASVVGFNPQTKTDVVVQTSKPAEIYFELVPQAIELQGVTVTSDYFRKDPL